jgi:hypothetical protein
VVELIPEGFLPQRFLRSISKPLVRMPGPAAFLFGENIAALALVSPRFSKYAGALDSMHCCCA